MAGNVLAYARCVFVRLQWKPGPCPHQYDDAMQSRRRAANKCLFCCPARFALDLVSDCVPTYLLRSEHSRRYTLHKPRLGSLDSIISRESVVK